MGKQYVYYAIRTKLETVLDELKVDYTTHTRTDANWCSHKWDSRIYKNDKIAGAYKKKYNKNLVIEKHSVYEFEERAVMDFMAGSPSFNP